MKYERIDLTTVSNISFKLIIPTRKNTDKYPKYYIEYTLNGRQFQVTKNVKKVFLAFDSWAKTNKLSKIERVDRLRELFMQNVNEVLNGLNIADDKGYAGKVTNLYSGVLESINEFLEYQKQQFAIGELSGIVNYSDRNKKLNAFFKTSYPDLIIKELNALVWDEFRNSLKKQGKANSTVNQYLTYVKSWYHWIINYHEVPVINHTNKLKKLDTSQQPKKYKDLPVPIIEDFFNAVKSDEKWLRLELIARLVGGNTVRPVQVRLIQSKHINLDAQIIDLFDKKSKKWRAIRVTDNVISLIKIIYQNSEKRGLEVHADDYLIGGYNAFKRGKPYTQNMIKDILVVPFRNAFPKLKDVNIYDFKHTSITKASKNGNLLEVQKRAGHSKITTTQIYDRSDSISGPITMEDLMLIK
ncbi:MAG: site-specific integrase [Pedobacter sp.]|nr:MAG: site-specific integrase [Pedobacter sp.]